ncbi:AMP-binding protein (plasmid) [Streptomyces sp. NBC_00536]|uniref:AMP-binding protein n=1 Tax=Streptomyces sp. NBC_00536 TaxID=2975769 RepID=UPI002E818B40|nr:AMP-binding protein [Streptomyces sp. NBC_00536]WUC84115.1 AMP-binding protein [Streptomyces sp. NBC_00536]
MVQLWNLLSASVHDATMLHTPSRQEEPVSGPALFARAERTAGGILAACDGRLPRRAGLLMANGEPWVRGLLALLRLDAAAVPLALPVAFGGADAYAAHIQRIAADASLDALLVDGSLGSRIVSRVAAAVPHLPVIDIAEPPRDAVDLPPVRGGGDAAAVIQYTSGSTSAPKGVVVTHDNIDAGLDAIGDGTRWGPEDALGQWLPLFHDMGLFTMLASLRHGTKTSLWQPGDFVRRPMQWLGEFAASRSTILPAPNFFYDYLVAAAAKGIPDDLDLSAWRYGGNGSEPVRLSSLEAFQRTFAPYGLRPQVVQPNYGLAEATLIVSSGIPRTDYRSLLVDRADLSVGDRVTESPEAGPTVRTVVSCGPAVAGIEVRIGDAEGTPLPEGTVGEVQIGGAPVTTGYLGLPAAEQPFTADGLLRTGDIGFLHDRELYVIGRMKAMAVVRGQNYYAEDVEEIVKATPGVDRRHCAAFAWDVEGEERMVVIWETRLDGDSAAAVGEAIRARLLEHLGLGAVETLAVSPQSLPFTSSGKVKRSGAADLYRQQTAALTTTLTTAPEGHSQ